MPLTPSLSPSDGERVSAGRVRGILNIAFTPISLLLIANWNKTMKRSFLNAFFCWAALRSASTTGASETSETKTTGDYVILLHGMGRTSASMKGLEWYLSRRGYRVVNVNYRSARVSIEFLADRQLYRVLQDRIANPAVKVHFVTHSLGGIILRQYLSNHSIQNLGRVVMLAPPNQGSELADFLKSNGLGRWILGKSGQQLGTAATDTPRRLGPVRFELGVIAGDRSWNPLFSWIIPGPDDGKVSVEATKVEGMKAFLVVHSTHTWLMWRRKTLRQIEHFLAHARFDQSEQPGSTSTR